MRHGALVAHAVPTTLQVSSFSLITKRFLLWWFTSRGTVVGMAGMRTRITEEWSLCVMFPFIAPLLELIVPLGINAAGSLSLFPCSITLILEKQSAILENNGNLWYPVTGSSKPLAQSRIKLKLSWQFVFECEMDSLPKCLNYNMKTRRLVLFFSLFKLMLVAGSKIEIKKNPLNLD